MFKKITAATFATALIAPGFALAQSGDTDGDGMVSMSEFQAAYPEASADVFSSVDTDADGALSDEEIAAAQEAGTLPEVTTDG